MNVTKQFNNLYPLSEIIRHEQLRRNRMIIGFKGKQILIEVTIKQGELHCKELLEANYKIGASKDHNVYICQDKDLKYKTTYKVHSASTLEHLKPISHFFNTDTNIMKHFSIVFNNK